MDHGKGRCWYMTVLHYCHNKGLNPLNAELNPIWHLQALLGAHHILHVSRISVNGHTNYLFVTCRWTVVNNREDFMQFCVQVGKVGGSYHLVSVFGQ